MRFSISASSFSSWRRFSSSRHLLAAVALLARVGLGHGGQLLAQLGEQLGLLLLHGVHLALHLFKVVAHRRQGRVGQGAGGPALRGIAAACQVGLGDGLGLFGPLGGLGIDQDDFQRRVLEHAVEALGVDEAHREEGRVHGHRHAQGNLQRAEGAEEASGCSRRRIIGVGGGGAARLRSHPRRWRSGRPRRLRRPRPPPRHRRWRRSGRPGVPPPCRGCPG